MHKGFGDNFLTTGFVSRKLRVSHECLNGENGFSFFVGLAVGCFTTVILLCTLVERSYTPDRELIKRGIMQYNQLKFLILFNLNIYQHWF